MKRRITRFNDELYFEIERGDGWETLPIYELQRGLFEVSYYGFVKYAHETNEAFELYLDAEFMHEERKRTPHVS